MALPQRSASTETATETAAPQPQLKLLPKPGRPSLFKPERTAAIGAIIEQEGISDSAAGALAGVTASTLARWKLEHEGFALELEKARALFELAQVRRIRDARKRDGSPDWRTAAWLLKHSSAEGFGPNSRMRKGKAQAQEQPLEGAAQNEKCANLPETRAEAGGRVAQAGGPVPDEREIGGTVAPQNGANLPETTAGDAPAQRQVGPRLTRRERRAEERRLAKSMRAGEEGTGK